MHLDQQGHLRLAIVGNASSNENNIGSPCSVTYSGVTSGRLGGAQESRVSIVTRSGCVDGTVGNLNYQT
jgi:hypothetical protein